MASFNNKKASLKYSFVANLGKYKQVRRVSSLYDIGKYHILTIRNVIVLNALVFKHKAKYFQLDLPRSVRKTEAENSPLPGATHESNNEWFKI